MNKCTCGSYAINIDPDGFVCDTCFWKNKHNNIAKKIDNIMDIMPHRVFLTRDEIQNIKNYIMGE